MVECRVCRWYWYGFCHNPDADYLAPVSQDDYCELFDREREDECVKHEYRELTEEEREEERRTLEAWEERRERGPGYFAPLCGVATENDAYRA